MAGIELVKGQSGRLGQECAGLLRPLAGPVFFTLGEVGVARGFGAEVVPRSDLSFKGRGWVRHWVVNGIRNSV